MTLVNTARVMGLEQFRGFTYISAHLNHFLALLRVYRAQGLCGCELCPLFLGPSGSIHEPKLGTPALER